jgi:hypothetical protein
MATAKVLKWPVDGQGESPSFGPYVRVRPTKRQIRDALELGILTVKDDEQRGFDPVSGREILNESKMKRWADYELEGRLFIGQLNYALHGEVGTTYELSPKGDEISITGPVLVSDGRQRSYTLRGAVDTADQYEIAEYDTEVPVEVTLWLDADTEMRKEIYAQLNGGRGGDHASKSSVEWMAPEGPLQEIVKVFVQSSKHLGHDNVNVKKDAVSRGDKRLAGFHTFVRAFEDAWGKRRWPTPEEKREMEQFLLRFYDVLVEVRPEMGVVDLGTRQKARETLITSQPLFIYGVMQVALDLFFGDDDPDLSVLDSLQGAKGDEFLSLDNPEWKDVGVMLPQFDRRTEKVKGYKLTNTLQSRRAMAQAMHDRFAELTGSD